MSVVIRKRAGSMLLRSGKRLAGAMVRNAGPVARAAYIGSQLGQTAGRFLRRMRKKKRQQMKVKGKRSYRTQGRYAGRIKKRMAKKSKIDIYNRFGFTNTTEITGTVSDPDCVYIGHSTTSGARILTIFLQSCLRKLFRQAVNWTCTNVTDPILGYEGASDGFRLIMFIKDVQAGTTTTVTYDTIVSDSIARIVGDNASGVAPAWPNLYNFWVNYISQAGGTIAGSVQQPTRLAIYQRDGNITNFYHFMGDIYFPNEVINLKVVSELKIQNRTLSASGSGDAEDVTNNPLIGKGYQVNSGVPRVRVENCDLISHAIDATGVITRRAAEFPTATQVIMREPPNPKIFWNLAKSANVMIAPGDIKKDVITFTVKKPVYEFFQMLDWRFNTGAVAVAGSMKAIGKATLFALEDMINVNATQNISIAYEVNRREMCYLTTNKNTIAQGGFYQQTQSSNPT